MSEQFLYQIIEALEQAGMLKDIPAYLERSFSPNILIRDYQSKAFQYFITYFENEKLRKNKQIHTLFHMATGSGKTVIMAGLLLYLFEKGYRKFLFFVNQTNILEKTKSNFLNPSSGKYLFRQNIEINGESVAIRQVRNFSVIDQNAINICFTTTQQLHLDLNITKENGLSIEDFEDDKIVLISDESHHINTKTKKGIKEEEEETTWEYSAERIFKSNRDSVLIEFTATCDLKDPAVMSKYKDKIIFDYPLTKFRSSGYTKDFQNLQSELDKWERTLVAMIISEYRRNLFADCGQNIKPVILLKSQYIADSQAFYEEFFMRLQSLRPIEIQQLVNSSNRLLEQAVMYFTIKDATLLALVNSLKNTFSQENSIIMNGNTDNSLEKQLAVNSLEEASNPYRIIFTVDMLNEGWDVLNLFDIVRLYETRQGRAGKISSYTIKEAQLIGRGARYCPFIAEFFQERYKRKYDFDLENPNRILETLLYHSRQDSRYINELRLALKATGLLPENPIEIEYRIKEGFKETGFYKNGNFFINRLEEKPNQDAISFSKKLQTTRIYVQAKGASSRLFALFDEEEAIKAHSRNVKEVKLRDIPLNILRGAIEKFDALRFDSLKSSYPQLGTEKEFLVSPDYCGNITLTIEIDEENLTARHYFDAAVMALGEVAKRAIASNRKYIGSKRFYAKPVSEILRNKRVYIESIHGDGLGLSQALMNKELAIDLRKEEWYVFEDHFGTKEEKALVRYIFDSLSILKAKYEEVFLIRNERFAELAIYDFDTGERFEPDFLLVLRRKNQSEYEHEQIFIEPKGAHLVDQDIWKEAFLLKIEVEGSPMKVYVDNTNYRIIGLPFFNGEDKFIDFDRAFKLKLLSE